MGLTSLKDRAVDTLVVALSALSPAGREAVIRELNDGEAEPLPDFTRMASWDELRSLDPGVLEVGSHTCSHPDMRSLADASAVRRELAGSKAAIEHALGRPVAHFSYPNGWYDIRLAREVAACGYASAVTTRYGFNGAGQDPFQLHRVNGVAGPQEFKAFACGSFVPYQRLHEMRKVLHA